MRFDCKSIFLNKNRKSILKMPLANSQTVHRPGPFKQVNKSHKSRKGKKTNDKGRTDVKTVTRRKKRELGRIQRRNRLKQLRTAKREKILKLKGRVIGDQAAPVNITILSLSDSISALEFLENIKSCDETLTLSESALGYCQLNSSRLKQRFTFLTPCRTDMHSVMDSLKVSQNLLLLHSTDELDNYTEMLLTVIVSHSLPTTIHVIPGLDKLNPKRKAESKKLVNMTLESIFPDAKISHADTSQELQLLLRNMGSQKQRIVSFRDNRPHLLAEDMVFEENKSTPGKGVLKVSGYIHGQPLNVNGLVHISGWGTYQMSHIIHKLDPFPLDNKSSKEKLFIESTDEINPDEQESLQSEIVPDPMEAEQTWPTEEEILAAELCPKKKVRKVAKGISEYQASWIIDSEDEGEEDSEEDSEEEDSRMESESDAEESDDDEMNSNDLNKNDEESVADSKEENYDKTVDMEEERKMLVRFQEERMNRMFPDELDTPDDVTARERFARYRGLKSFKYALWDPMENLPLDYARIYRFHNFKQTKKRVLKSNAEKEGALPGQFVTIHITGVPQSFYDNACSERTPVVVYGLLPHEQKMSVLNVLLKKHPSCDVPIKSKDPLIFHVGYNRFQCRPIFSEHRNGNKFKFERFMPSNASFVATFFAPVIFPSAPVVVFRRCPDGSHALVATGSVLDVNPNRIVVKRVLLSGLPFKISKHLSIIRYMFFNKEDIDWFKCVQLRTKCGRQGHIRDSLGSHGHMKCLFDKQLDSQDVVLMDLYKRVFPKWTYDPCVPTPINANDDYDLESMM